MDYIKKNKIERNTVIKREGGRNGIRKAVVAAAGVLVLAAFLLTAEAGHTSYQTRIAEEILRFHVIANSDSEEDQQLKLKVKEEVLGCLRPKLANARNVREAEEIIVSNMEEIEEAANSVIGEEGYSYKSKGVLGKTIFPIKQYGDLVFPAGEYEAFRILLGKAEGKNWWCVMFPTLCFADETYDVITEENKEQFKELLTEEEYESLLPEEGAEESQFFYKLKVAVWLDKVIDYFSK